jgi:hypothetical protein
MEKFCVFCGQKPSSKNKEHVIPLWLIELTGDPNRKATFGPFLDTEKMALVHKEFAFDQFKFPACKECNEKHSELENNARDVIVRLIKDDVLASMDFMVLLDWLDKIRIGLWLAYNYIQKNLAEVEPNYYIANRIGRSDRATLIYKTDAAISGINLTGTSFPAFQYDPTCFNIRINQYSFFNLATDFLLSKYLGFPYLRESYYSEGKETIFSIAKGKNQILYPLIRKSYNKKCTEIYQPLFSRRDMRLHLEKWYDTEHVHSLSHDYANGIGKVLIGGENRVSEYPIEKSDKWIPKYTWNFDEFSTMIARQTLEFQIYFINHGPKYGEISIEKKKLIKEQLTLAKQVNRQFLKMLDED